MNLLGNLRVGLRLAIVFGIAELLVIAIVSMTVVRLSALHDGLAAAPARRTRREGVGTLSTIFVTLGVALLLCGGVARWITRSLPPFDLNRLTGMIPDTYHGNSAHPHWMLASFKGIHCASIAAGGCTFAAAAGPLAGEQGAPAAMALERCSPRRAPFIVSDLPPLISPPEMGLPAECAGTV